MHTSRHALRPLLTALLAAGLPLGAAFAQGTPAPAAPAAVAEPTLDIRGFKIDGDNPLSEAQTGAVLAPFTGDKRGLSQIEAAATALERAIRAEGFVFHRVFVPVQKPVDGQISLQILRFTLDQVTMSGNEKFSTENIRRSLPALVEGKAPDIYEIGRDLTAANANPAKQVQVTFRESAKPDAVDAVLRVKDTDPLAYFVNYTTNYSVRPRAPNDNVHRLTAGLQHANLFDRDHVGALTYTTDPNRIRSVTLFGAYYQMPIYGTGINLSAYLNSSDVNSGQVAGGIDVSGQGQFMGVRATLALERRGKLQQTVGLALDRRYFENNSTFNGARILPNVGSMPLSVRYTARQEETWGTVGGSIDLVTNLGFGRGNSGQSYAANGGTRTWNALRYAVDGNYRINEWTLTGRWRGQFSGNALIAGEQFGLGGVGSVRGFADRVVAGDRGYSVNLEAQGPEMFFPQFRPLFFLDTGRVHSRTASVTEDLLSVGVGLRWSSPHVDVSADLGKVLSAQIGELRNNPVRLHVALTYRF
ncbi:MAG: ShlB/FhaC/HecB family hemolysin secretion/activation protein [Rhodoferax sp.]